MNRFLLPLLGALALLAPLSGCDTAEVDEVYDGPTVSFSTTGANAAEGDTVSVEVRLADGNGQPASVEVLYARGASSTTPGDLAGFGGDALVQTVTFAGTDGETQTVTFTVPDDGESEDSETAVFALQNAQGARIGVARTFSLSVGIPAIAATRAQANGSVVTVEGIVTRVAGRYVVIQDPTAAIIVFASNLTPFGMDIGTGAIRVGDRIQVTGALSEFQSGPTGSPVPGAGLLQISAASIPEGGYSVRDRDNDLPAAQRVTVAQITAPGDTYESEIVCVRGLTVAAGTSGTFMAGTGGGQTYVFTDATGSVDFRVGNTIDTDIPGGIVGTPIPTAPFAFVGAVGQFRGTNQLSPFAATDIRTDNTCPE